MDQIAENIKDFILANVNAELLGLAKTGLTLPAITKDNIVFGTVDLSRYEVPVVVSILPENQEPEPGFIDGTSQRSAFTVTFLFQKATYKVLVKRMCRYARAFWIAHAKEPDFGDLEESVITNIQYYPDTGAVAQQMTAFELSLDAITEFELEAYTPPEPEEEEEVIES